MADACIPRKTPKEFYDSIIAQYRSEVLMGNAVLDTDPMHVIASVMAGVLYQSQTDFERRVRSAAFLTEMCCDDLISFAATVQSPLKAAQPARGYVRITGVANAAIPSTISFTNSTATEPQEYDLDPLVSAASNLSDNGDGSGSATLLIRASTPGAAGNIADTSQTLTLTTAITDIEAEVEIAGYLSGGTDEETCEELRARLISQRQSPATCGNQEWFDAKLKQFPGVTRVCVESCSGGRCGGAYQTHYVFMDGVYPDGIPPADVVDSITDWMYGVPQGEGRGEAMVGLMGQVLSPMATYVNVRIINLSVSSPATTDALRTAFEEYFKGQACVGDTLCKSDLFAVVSSVLPTNCFSDVEITGDDVSTTNNGRDYKIANGMFPKLGTLS